MLNYVIVTPLQLYYLQIPHLDIVTTIDMQLHYLHVINTVSYTVTIYQNETGVVKIASLLFLDCLNPSAHLIISKPPKK